MRILHCDRKAQDKGDSRNSLQDPYVCAASWALEGLPSSPEGRPHLEVLIKSLQHAARNPFGSVNFVSLSHHLVAAKGLRQA